MSNRLAGTERLDLLKAHTPRHLSLPMTGIPDLVAERCLYDITEDFALSDHFTWGIGLKISDAKKRFEKYQHRVLIHSKFRIVIFPQDGSALIFVREDLSSTLVPFAFRIMSLPHARSLESTSAIEADIQNYLDLMPTLGKLTLSEPTNDLQFTIAPRDNLRFSPEPFAEAFRDALQVELDWVVQNVPFLANHDVSLEVRSCLPDRDGRLHPPQINLTCDAQETDWEVASLIQPNLDAYAASSLIPSRALHAAWTEAPAITHKHGSPIIKPTFETSLRPSSDLTPHEKIEVHLRRNELHKAHLTAIQKRREALNLHSDTGEILA